MGAGCDPPEEGEVMVFLGAVILILAVAVIAFAAVNALDRAGRYLPGIMD